MVGNIDERAGMIHALNQTHDEVDPHTASFVHRIGGSLLVPSYLVFSLLVFAGDCALHGKQKKPSKGKKSRFTAV